jgi:hypothetical protein
MITVTTWPSVERCANHCCTRVVCSEPLLGLEGAITRMGWLGNLRCKQRQFMIKMLLPINKSNIFSRWL